MNKNDLVAKIASNTGLSKTDSANAVASCGCVVSHALDYDARILALAIVRPFAQQVDVAVRDAVGVPVAEWAPETREQLYLPLDG